MAKNFSGRDYKLYLSSSAPDALDHITDYTQVGYLTNVTVSQSRNAIETSSQTSGDNSSFIAGRRNVTVSGTAIWDHTSDSGQTLVNTSIGAAAGTTYILIGTGTVGDIGWHGVGLATTYNVSMADEATSQLDFTFQITGALTEFTADVAT